MTLQQYDPTTVNPGEEVTATAAALGHFQREMARFAGQACGIRFATRRSGCSGNAYVVDIIEQTNDDDRIFQLTDDVMVAISEKDWNLLKGTRFDYIKEGINHRLVFQNPNESGSCGCGESFSVD